MGPETIHSFGIHARFSSLNTVALLLLLLLLNVSILSSKESPQRAGTLKRQYQMFQQLTNLRLPVFL